MNELLSDRVALFPKKESLTFLTSAKYQAHFAKHEPEFYEFFYTDDRTDRKLIYLKECIRIQRKDISSEYPALYPFTGSGANTRPIFDDQA